MGTPKFNPPKEVSWWISLLLFIVSLLFFLTDAVWVTIFEKGGIGSFPYLLMLVSSGLMLAATKLRNL